MAVFIIVSLLLANLKGTLLVVSFIIMIDVDLLGLIKWWGLTVNAVTIIIVVMAIGLAVDYNAHIVHSWLTCKEAKANKTKIMIAIDEIGVSVLHGAISTFLAVVVMSFG